MKKSFLERNFPEEPFVFVGMSVFYTQNTSNPPRVVTKRRDL